MATWTFSNSTTYITVTRDSTTFRISKYAPITMTVSGTVLILSYSDTISQSNRKTNSRTFEVEYTDVTSPVVASASALRSTIEAWLPIAGTPGVGMNYSLDAYALLGGEVKAEPVGLTFSQIASNLTMVSQRATYVGVYLPSAATITGVKWYQNTQGDYTANNTNEINLYTYSGGTLTKVAGTGNDGNLWKASNSALARKAFTGTYSAAAGLYFIGYIWCASATVQAPVIGGTGTQSNLPAMDFSNSAKLWSILNAQTSLAATTQAMSGLSSSQFAGYVALY